MRSMKSLKDSLHVNSSKLCDQLKDKSMEAQKSKNNEGPNPFFPSSNEKEKNGMEKLLLAQKNPKERERE
jgi:hypothetical protein